MIELRPKHESRLWPWWRWTLTGLSGLALALSAYLGWHYLVGRSVIGCGGPGAPGCEKVLRSRWATVGGVLPVSGLAAGAYLAMLLASLVIGPATAAQVRRLAWGAMLVLAGAVAGSAVWFTIVQKWVIGAFCPYCMATHITGLLLTVLVIWRAPGQFNDDSTDLVLTNPAPALPENGCRAPPLLSPVRPHLSSAPIGLALVGLALAGILAACQAGFTPPAVYRLGESRVNLPAIDPRAVPFVGSRDAPCIVTLLFDYQCPHCQQMHFMLDEAIRRYGGKLAFTLCPAPLDSQCNPYIPGDMEQFKDSCELAKVGLAVWVARREAFPAFDRWMFSFESGDRWHPRSLVVARAKAVELVGRANYEAARADPWIDGYMQTSIRIYGGSIQSGNGAVPKLVFGSRWVIPEPNDADDLVRILHDSLAVPRP
ncbi:MAG: vitamin K epoxide reductase family protein [Limisphaerales bacterium]